MRRFLFLLILSGCAGVQLIPVEAQPCGYSQQCAGALRVETRHLQMCLEGYEQDDRLNRGDCITASSLRCVVQGLGENCARDNFEQDKRE